jgi:iron complex outermembrane receptor protein
MLASPAMAQDASNSPNSQTSSPRPTEQDETQSPAPVPNTTQESDEEQVVVTGTLFRSTTSATVSPITVVTAEALDQRGIQTVQEGIQNLAVNNGPALTNSFTANGAFAAGASAVSLRGLSTNSTLVLFDGQRAAYYPLADDGSRNFVDLNTIPDDIVERIEVLREGASSTYGADAIAGVVNIITRREFNGVRARAEAGISQDGVNANQRLSLTLGTGDLDTNGMNAYISGFYFRQEAVMNRDLPFPFNTDNESTICFEGTCGPNNIQNSRDPITGAPNFSNAQYDVYVRPYNATNTTAQGRFELLNPTRGCQFGTGYTLTAAELAANPSFPAGQVCTSDLTFQFGTASPNIERFGGSARVTARIGDGHEAYGMVNFQQSTVNYTGFPPTIRNNAPAGILFPRFSTSNTGGAFAPGSFSLTLPVYVCPTGVGSANGLNTGCTATTPGAVLNPNNPFAAQGQVARLSGRPITEPTYNETRSRVYRAALGVAGELFDGWNYRVDATAMHNDLRRTQRNYVYIANLLTAIAQGTFNFVNPEANSQQARDFIAPEQINDNSSDLYAIQATLATELFQLPGGPAQLGFGGQIRYEAVDAPSGNPDINGPTQRYFTLNAFGASGERTVYSAFAELQAPVLDMLDINLSGRYDSYSSGQDAFSPRAAFRFTPIRQLAIRGSYSRGFRIPSFGEANSLPTTGFVTVGIQTLPNSFLNQYSTPGNPNGACSQTNAAGCPAYITSYSRGLTTLATPDLDPERSRSFTLGAIFNPIPALTLTVDYYNIEKTGAIASAPIDPALTAYFACTAAQANNGTCPIPAGYSVTPDAPDPNFPNALPRPGFVGSPLQNANRVNVEGLDFAALARFNFGNVRFTSALEASWIINLSTTFEDGSTQTYEGTLGNYALTAGSGTPEWRATWQNTLEFDPIRITGTVNYFDGYDLSAEDETGPGTAFQCGLSPGFVPCRVDEYITLDLVTQIQVNDNFTFYFNILNVLDELPPIDAATYGAHLYNPVQAGSGIYGRQFRAGVRVNF